MEQLQLDSFNICTAGPPAPEPRRIYRNNILVLSRCGKFHIRRNSTLDFVIKLPLEEEIVKVFPILTIEETLVLLRSMWIHANKETQEQEFLQLIHAVRPDLTWPEAGRLFARLIEERYLEYVHDSLVWRKPNG